MPSFVTMGAAFVCAALFVVALLCTSVGIGRRLLLLLGLREQGRLAERVALATLLGAGALQFVPFALGAAGVLSVSSLRIACAVVALASIPDCWRVVRDLRAAANGWSRPTGWLLAWLLALLPGLGVALLLALTPTLDADGLGYHLTVPKRWLLSGSLGYLPTYPYSNTPMGVEMLFMSGMAVAGDTAAKLTHLALGLVAALGVYLAGRRLSGRVAGAIAASVFLFGPFGVGPLLGWAYLEGIVSGALIGSALAWLAWFQERDRAWLRCAALLAGFGASFKITAGLFPVSLGVLTLLLSLKDARRVGDSLVAPLVSILRLVPLLLAPVLPWLVRSALLTGNPVFPIAAQWIPSRDFSPSLAAKFEAYNRYMVWGSSLGPGVTLERRKLIFLGIALILGLVGAFFAWRQRSTERRTTAWVIVGTLLLQLAAVGLYKRYWIPVLAVFQLPIIALFATETAGRWLRQTVIAVTAVASLYCAKQGLSSVQYDVAGLLKTAVGAEDQRSFLLAHLPLFPIYERANSEQPPPSGIGLSQYCGGFYLEQPTFCADIAQDSLRYTSFPLFTADLRRLGISHFIAPIAWAEPGSRPSIDGGNAAMLVREREHACVSQLIRENARLLSTAADQGLYAVDLASLR